ncbi:MAG: hypothetical protein ACFB4I_04825 [Cyanophyceae cyanobacterium]
MNTDIKERTFPRFLTILLIVAIILGVIFRFSNLDQKLYSLDETFSTTYIFGHNLEESGIYEQVIPIKELQNFQKLDPEENLVDGVYRLIDVPYVFPPLYAILMQIWSRLWLDDSVSPALITRSLSSLISLLSFVGMYWLCWELSGSKKLALIGTAILAISPYHLQYAQIVRTYSLTTATTLLSSASLLRALRLNNWKNWGLYAVNVAFGLYSHLLFEFGLIAQVVFVVFIEKFRITKRLRSFVVALAIGVGAFLPWFIKWITRPGLFEYSVAQPAAANLSFTDLLRTWIVQIPTIFVHFNDPWRDFTQNFQTVQRLYTPLILLLMLLSIYFVCRSSLINSKSRILILAFIILGGCSLMARDVLTGNSFSTRLRYMIPYVLGIELAVICYLFTQIETGVPKWKKRGGEVVLTLLIVGGIFSGGIITKAESWSAFGSPDFPKIAQRINQFERPLVIFNDSGDALTMSYLLHDNVSAHIDRPPLLELLEENTNEDSPQRFSEVILFKPSSDSIQRLEKAPEWNLSPLFSDPQSRISNVWQVNHQNFQS